MDQPRPILVLISVVALIAMAAGVYVAVVAETSVTPPAATPPVQPAG
jgi:hypothetical protein